MKILVVEDEAITAEEIVSSLNEFGYYDVENVQNGEDALEYVKNNSVEFIFMDILLSTSLDGIETVKRIQELDSDISIVYLTSFVDDTMDRAIKTDPLGYLVKPYQPHQLLAMIKIAKNKNQPSQNKGKEFIFFLDDQFSFNTLTKELFYNDINIKLRPKEAKLLELILKNKHKAIIQSDEIIYEIWETPPQSDKTKRSLISSLNSKVNFKLLQGNYDGSYKILI